MYLTGTYKHNLDAKGRITLPASFRKQFDDVVCLIPVEGAVYGFSPEGHKAWVESFFPNGFDPRSKRDVKLRRLLASMTITVELDAAGRLALGKLDPQKLAACHIEREVSVVGNIDHFEIWDSAIFDAEQEDDEQSLEELMFNED